MPMGKDGLENLKLAIAASSSICTAQAPEVWAAAVALAATQLSQGSAFCSSLIHPA